MDHWHIKDFKDEGNPIVKAMKGASIGLAAGAVWGSVVAMLYDDPLVERNVSNPSLVNNRALRNPALVRSLKVCGNYGLTFAALGGVYVGVEQLLEKHRMKRDFVNGAVGAFTAGALVLGLKGRNIKSALLSGSALALTSVILDIGGLKTTGDTDKDQ